jgi:N-ethylmaleimide reductase
MSLETSPFLQPLTAGDLALPNRIVMAPLTRMRSADGNVPGELAPLYYAQRAAAGLIVSEATQISPAGMGYPATPGIHSAAQVAGWAKVTDAVHKAGGRIVLQLWHVGRISHRSLQPGGALPVAPSAIKPSGGTFGPDWKPVEFETPRALETAEIPGLIAQFAAGARNAKDAGFDGVEVHGANGYLLDQFLQSGSNLRTDAYGGPIANRARLLLEAVDAAVSVWGAGRVGVRLSPYGQFNDMRDDDPPALFGYVAGELDKRKIAYLHVIEPRATSAGANDAIDDTAPKTGAMLRAAFKGALIGAGGFTRDAALAALRDKTADAVAFGRLFISNPDLVNRLAKNLPLAPYDRSTFYGGGAKGYTDYPQAA